MTEHKKVEWRGNAHNLPDGSYTDKEGDVCYIKDGKRHREDGPAITLASGYKFWYKDGEYHREGGPAVEWAFGVKFWYINGKKHKTKEDYEEALKIWKMNEAMK